MRSVQTIGWTASRIIIHGQHSEQSSAYYNAAWTGIVLPSSKAAVFRAVMAKMVRGPAEHDLRQYSGVDENAIRTQQTDYSMALTTCLPDHHRSNCLMAKRRQQKEQMSLDVRLKRLLCRKTIPVVTERYTTCARFKEGYGSHYLFILLFILFVLPFINTSEVHLAVGLPLSCHHNLTVLKNTVNKAISDLIEADGDNSTKVTTSLVDVCMEAEALVHLVDLVSGQSTMTFDGLVGPASHPLCEPIARLGAYYKFPISSWTCTNEVLSQSHIYSTFSRTVPSSQAIAMAIIQLMVHFRWQYVGILYSGDDIEHWETAGNVGRELSRLNFTITQYRKLGFPELGTDNITAIFERADERTKG